MVLTYWHLISWMCQVFRDVSEIKSAFAEANVKMDTTSPSITR